MKTLRFLALTACAMAAASTASRSALADADSDALRGTWQKHEYTFQFMGFTSTYSCDGLADKLNLLLKAAGARSDSKAVSGGCGAGFGRPDKFARAYLTFYTLAPPAAGASADPGTVSAAWLPVAITDRSPRDLRTGDCELVDQFRTGVLPMFTTRSVASRTSCIPHQNSGSIVDLKFDVFGLAPGARKASSAL